MLGTRVLIIRCPVKVQIVILVALALIVWATGQLQNPAAISQRTYVFLVLSGLATGASWLCYFRALKLGQAGRSRRSRRSTR